MTQKARIRKELSRRFGAEVALLADLDSGSFSLFRCEECRLEFFSPIETGSSNFYKSLGELAYTGLRWDHLAVLQLLPPAQKIVDLGGGNGCFGNAAHERDHHVVVVDFSESITPEREFAVWQSDLSSSGWADEVPSNLLGMFDCVTSFQVLEHLADPVTFLRQASRLTRVGGCVALSVPNRNRFEVSTDQALDFPPHHLTRWSPEQFAWLAQMADLELEIVVEERVFDMMRIVFGLPFTLIKRLLSGKLPPTYRGLPTRPRGLFLGHSIVGMFRVPESRRFS